jgi:hypothetical protein
MTNFTLPGAPNFVLLVATAREAGAPRLGQPSYLNPVLSEALRILSVAQLAQGDSQQVTFDDASIVVMRQILARYGFDLPPLTSDELYGLLEYCDRLDALTGACSFGTDQLSQWRGLSAGLDRGDLSPGRRAIDLYSQGDTRGLRRLHQELRTLVRLGRAYRAMEASL